ncbi:MAG: TonB-dependent receptor [Rikenellaceae bacterium]
MKKGFLLLFFLAITLCVNAQKVTLNFKNASLERVFAEITEQTELTLAYSSNDVNINKNVSVNVRKQELAEVLKTVLNGTNIDFEIANGKIYLTKKSTQPVQSKSVKVVGTVVSLNGKPIVGATVAVQGSNVGSVTNLEGKYELTAMSNQKLVVSYIGYDTKSLNVTSQETKRIVLTEDVTSIEDVVIVGYRKSLSKAIDIKQQSVNITDAIVADDIAKFPQSNVAEALQRVSGIQIVRDDAGGVGNQVSVRGMSAEYTQVTINGDAAANSDASESFNFNTMPSEIFSKVEVAKSPTAKMSEGGIGGTVDLTIRKPFELDDEVFIITAEGQTNTQTQTGMEVTPKVSLTYGNNWKNKKFGIIAGASYNKFSNTSESYDVVRYEQKSFDLDNDGTFEHQNVRIALPRLLSQGQVNERVSLNLSAQYRINNDMHIVWSGMWVYNKNVATRYTPIWFTNDATPTAIESDGTFVKSISFDSVEVMFEDQIHTNTSNNYQSGLTYKWNMRNNWSLGAKASYSLNTTDQDRYRYYASANSSMTYSVQDNYKFFDIETPTNFSDVNQFTMTEARHYIWDDNDEIITGKFDVVKKFNNKLKLEFGGSSQSRTKDRTYWYKKDEGIMDSFAPVAGLLTGFMDNVSEATLMNQFLVHDWDKSYELYGSKIDMSDAIQMDAYYDINQFVNSGYAMADYRINKLKANAGVRYAHTQITAKGYDIDSNTGEYGIITKKSSYDDFLPSLSVSYEPLHKLFVKGSFARVLTRPRIQDLSSYQDVDDINMTISAKNPDLDPYRANQYDLSVEWYPTKEVMLSAGIFRKDIESFITTQTSTVMYDGDPYQLTQPVNGDNAVVQGVEVNYQQPFTFLPSPFDGFGISANYTLSLSEYYEEVDGVGDVYDMPGNSKHSYNIIGYYEKYGFGFRVAYNYRSSYLREAPDAEDGLKYRAGYGQTDISASYEFGRYSITANVLNAFNAQRYEYIWEEKYMDNVAYSGTTFQIGLRIKL